MFKRTAEDLGLDIVLNTIASKALSCEGTSLVKSAIPVSLKDVYLKRQSEVSSVIFAITLAEGDNLQAESFPPISDVFENIEANPTASLEGEQIYRVFEYIKSAQILSDVLCYADNVDNHDLNSKVHEIINGIDASLKQLAKETDSILESPGIVRENYPTVKALREKAENTRDLRTRTAKRMMHDNFSIMHSDSAVLRDGRLVLPVKNESKSQMKGYVQSSSQTGETVFMEPFELVDMNNAVIMANQEIQIEIARLLSKLSVMIRENEMLLRDLVNRVSRADFLYAFATWIMENKCAKVMLSNDYTVNLIKARHPLLGNACVPIDLAVPKGIRAVVLTGPNAGGKTVTMKTVGLFSLLNQICGYIPCDDGSSLSLFDRVFTDIGDDQSIQNKLSTFSGHMKSIGFVLRNLTENSLVILDELGSGTDPQEGACLARSILEFTSSKALLSLTTSHHGVLKQYAYSNHGVLNASMEFDEKTMEPTFKVINGLPGESHAIDTAKRMGLPKAVTSNAMKYMGQEAVKISSIIKGLEAKRKEADDKLNDINRRLKGIENKERHLANEQRRIDAYENKLKKYMLSDFDEHLKASRKELENTVREVREGELTKEKITKVKTAISNLQKERDVLENEISQRDKKLFESDLKEMRESSDNVELKVGMDVWCGKNKREGTIVRKEKDGMWQVAIGPMKFTFKETELTVPVRLKQTNATYSFEGSSSAPKPKLNLDLRGFRLQEALDAIEDEIEACCVHGIRNFSIIHGYGDGILSTGIHNFLRMKANVEDYKFALPDDGGQGKTYVRLK